MTSVGFVRGPCLKLTGRTSGRRISFFSDRWSAFDASSRVLKVESTGTGRVRPIRSCTTASAAPTEAAVSAEGLNRLVENRNKRRFVFVNGKGGVGKTTSASAIAVRLADSGFKTLVLSTDPAHSLGDCLDVDLSSGEILKITDNLSALECDTADAVAELQKTLSALKDVGAKGGDISTAKEMADRLGLSEFGEVFSTLPPGADEFVALAKVLRLAEDAEEGYDRIVIDTAPTGHTLRLLAFPDFLDNFLEKATELRKKLDVARSAINSVSALLGTNTFSEESLRKAADRVEAYRSRMAHLSGLLRDPSQSEFVVVSIATKLSVMETQRLLSSLQSEGIWVRNLVVNQLITQNVSKTFEAHLIEGQEACLERARTSFPHQFLTKVFRFDMEVRGVFGLRSFAQVAFPEKQLEERWKNLFDPSHTDGMFVFVGGKGGVGKTSTSAAMAVKCADQGEKTLVISTDPAHSLSDALDVPLSGDPTPIENTDGNLFAMEIDTERAVQEFKDLVKNFSEGSSGIAQGLGLDEFAGILDNTPPGIDELVALTQVVRLVKSGEFQRVIVDTAPTGHTLRLLSFPDFLDSFLGRVLRLKRRVDSIVNSLKGVFVGEKVEKRINNATKKIDEFRANMTDLQSLLADQERTQFCVVTIPTNLGMAESERLVASLEKDEVAVRNVIVNQIVPEDSSGSYVKRRFREQAQYLQQLEDLSDEDFPLALIRVDYFDEEVRGLARLQKMATVLFDQQETN